MKSVPKGLAVSSTNQPSANQAANAANGQRQASIDAYRGLVMFLMLAEVLHLDKLASKFPDSTFFQHLRFHTTHVEWIGCSLHDMIQPSFSFLVGVSLPFSIAARKIRGGTLTTMLLHALSRALILVALGIALRSMNREVTYFTFEDTLTQIGLGYFFLFCIGLTSMWQRIGWCVLILFGYWLTFAQWTLPVDFDPTKVGVPSDWPHWLSGFQAHWNKNANPAWAVDVWFLNLFPREKVFEYNAGGYCTLSFVPTLATMIMGLLAGQVLKSPITLVKKFSCLIMVGLSLTVVGWGLGALELCPIVKRIWTPSFALFSGGLCSLALGTLLAICDGMRFRILFWPFMIIGANSIAAYLMSWALEKPIQAFWQRHLGRDFFLMAGEMYQPLMLGTATLLTMWLILLWMFRKRIFIRI